MRFWVYDTEDIWSDMIGNMTPLAPTGANCVYVPRRRGIACNDLVVGDTDVWAVFLVQCLDMIDSVAVQDVELKNETSQVCMPGSGNST